MDPGGVLAWAETRDLRYEFDGVQPVAVSGGTVNHGIVRSNLGGALYVRLRGGRCQPLGPDNGIATVGTALRYPDAIMTCSQQEGNSRLVVDPVAVFEIIGPSTHRMDPFEKVREYAAVPSIRRFV